MRIMRFGKKTLALGLAVGIISSVSSQTALKIAGSTVFKNALLEPNKQFLEEKTGLKLEIVGNGSGRGLQDLVAGTADIAMISSQLSEVAEKINAKTPGAITVSSLKASLIGTAKVEIAVHPSNPLKSLKAAQVVDLLSGKVKNWNEVGGPDLPVVVVTAQSGDGTRTTVEKHLLNDVAFSSEARQLASATQVPIIVGQIPGAIGAIAAAIVSSAVSIVKLDKVISAPLFLITKGEPDASAQKLITELKKIKVK